MSVIEKKEKNLDELIGKLNTLTSTYSQPTYEVEKIKTEKNELLRQKIEIEKKKLRTDERTQVFKRKNSKFTIRYQ